MSIQSILIEGGIVPMAIITVGLIALIIARFKSHSLVKYIGIGTLVVSIFLAMCAFIGASDAISGLDSGTVPTIAWDSVHTACLNVAYGLVVYLISLIFRAHFKTRK